MAFEYWLSAITFSDDSSIQLSMGEVVIIVGPNNAGKSRALRDIQDFVQGNRERLVVVRSVVEHKGGTGQELKEYLISNFSFRIEGARNSANNLSNYNISGAFVFLWGEEGDAITWRPFLVNRLDIEQRLAASKPAPSFDPLQALPSHPLHRLYDDDRLMGRLNEWVQRAFKQKIAIDLRGGTTIPLYAGAVPDLAPNEKPTDTSYVRRLRAETTPLHEQGDGMRGFVGVLINTLLLGFKVQLIDEPEAFLHPPQAQLLGEILCRYAEADRQLILSTHSGDFLRGVLKSQRNPIRIIRIRRKGNVNHVKTITPELIKQFWSDPILLYSNVLDGIFHEKVVICESEADSRFYGAIADALRVNPDHEFANDIMFIHSGGKHAVSKLGNALRQLDVPLATVVDIDVLREEQPLRSIVEAFGGTWRDIERGWKIVHKAITKLPPLKDFGQILSLLKLEIAALETDQERTPLKLFPQETARKIENALRSRTPGALLKSSGRSALPQGQETEAFDQLVANLKEIGIFVVELGELERFVQTVGGEGPRWVNDVLLRYAGELSTSPDLEQARRFVSEFIAA